MGQYLSSPCTLVEVEQGKGEKMEFGVGSLQVFHFYIDIASKQSIANVMVFRVVRDGV